MLYLSGHAGGHESGEWQDGLEDLYDSRAGGPGPEKTERASSCGDPRVPRSGLLPPSTWNAGRLYVTTGDNYSDPASLTSDAIVAFDLRTGAFLWSQQFTPNDAWNIGCETADDSNCPEARGPDLDFGSSSILVKLPSGKRVLLAGQKSGVLHAVDPDRDGENSLAAAGGERRPDRGHTVGAGCRCPDHLCRLIRYRRLRPTKIKTWAGRPASTGALGAGCLRMTSRRVSANGIPRPQAVMSAHSAAGAVRGRVG